MSLAGDAIRDASRDAIALVECAHAGDYDGMALIIANGKPGAIINCLATWLAIAVEAEAHRRHEPFSAWADKCRRNTAGPLAADDIEDGFEDDEPPPWWTT